MTIRVATVLSAREWEPELVAVARDTAALRIVLRAFQPRDIERNATGIDVVVAGGDVTWVTPHQLATWRRLGLAVVGVHPPEDLPAASLLELGGAAEVVPDTIETEALIQAIRFAAPSTERPKGPDRATVTAVVGARGAPGATEIACALAKILGSAHPTVLIDGDLGAPSIAIRLGIAPRPDIADAADAVRSDGVIDSATTHSVRGFDVITGSHRDGELPIRDQMLAGLIEASASRYRHVVVDSGSHPLSESVLDTIDAAVLVIDASPVGIVRAARLAGSWLGPTPTVVLNKVTAGNQGDSVEAVKRWTGLEPAAVIPLKDRVRRGAASGQLPHRSMCRPLSTVGAAR